VIVVGNVYLIETKLANRILNKELSSCRTFKVKLKSVVHLINIYYTDIRGLQTPYYRATDCNLSFGSNGLAA
jgi:hypothetical protein